jgi:serine/threonine protein phosphatase PrpC
MKPIKNEVVNKWFNSMNCGFGRQGKRPTMEDEELIYQTERFDLYAVFDGHGGELVSKFCKQHLPKYLIDDMKMNYVDTESITAMKKWIEVAVVSLEKYVYSSMGEKSMRMGCTCIAALFDKQKRLVYMINIGDSRGVLFLESGEIVSETKDHKPNDPSELRRIEKAGGFVTTRNGDTYRVNGNLALSRSFGDWKLKLVNNNYSATEGPVSVMPDIYVSKLEKKQNYYLVLACDGLWDTMTTKQVVTEYIHKMHIQSNTENSCTRLVNKSYNNGSRDNISVLAVGPL